MTLSTIPCSGCNTENQRNFDICTSCGHSLGFVNVNIYADPYFKQALQHRYKLVRDAEKLKSDELNQFEAVLEAEGKALINMNFKMLCQMLIDKQEYLPYRMAVELGMREKSAFLNDKDRCMVESAFYGIDGGKIVYATLALDDNGLLNYGKMTVILRTKNIETRTTIFERNTYHLFDEFVENGWKVKGSIPPGHCGTWELRSQVAVCKHGKTISESNLSPDLSTLILHSGTDRDLDEFMELHIYNKVSWQAIEQVSIHEPPKSKFDQLQLEILAAETQNHNIEFVQK